jgi:hypothetical protein
MIARRIRVPMNGAKAKLGLLAALLSIAGAGEAKALDPDHLRAPPKSDGPLQVQIGFHVFDDKMNASAETASSAEAQASRCRRRRQQRAQHSTPIE